MILLLMFLILKGLGWVGDMVRVGITLDFGVLVENDHFMEEEWSNSVLKGGL